MKTKMKGAAFTLIELLVVIAIIAILAAILFPVFAQAKQAAKKAGGIAQQKQMGTAVMIYVADYDDKFPAGITQRTSGTWRYSNLHPFPEDGLQSGGWNAAGVPETVAVHWANSLYPYIKNIDIYVAPGQTDTPLSGIVYTPGVTLGRSGSNYNGLLQFLSTSSVDNPSIVPMFFYRDTGYYTAYAVSAPTLRCQATGGLCMFNSGGLAQPGNPSGNQSFFASVASKSVFVYGKGTVFTRTDSSAKWQRVGNAIDPNVVPYTSSFNDPYARVYNENGTGGFSYWTTCADGINNYVCFFRPDRPE